MCPTLHPVPAVTLPICILQYMNADNHLLVVTSHENVYCLSGLVLNIFFFFFVTKYYIYMDKKIFILNTGERILK